MLFKIKKPEKLCLFWQVTQLLQLVPTWEIFGLLLLRLWKWMCDINFSSSWPKRIRQQTEAIGKKSTAVHSDWEEGIKYVF